MSDQFNLLDLPDLVLEEIFLYCKFGISDRKRRFEYPLQNLIQCCKFLKNYIETNPRLMRKMVLDVPTNCDFSHCDDNKEAGKTERLRACLDSMRRFVNARFYYSSNRYEALNDDDKSEIDEKKALADMHSETIKNVEFTFSETRTDSKAVLHVLKYLEKLENVEEVNVTFDIYNPVKKSHRLEKPYGWNWSDYGNSFVFLHKFKHLKKLTMETECSTVFNVFKSCENIEILKIIRFGLEYLTEYDMLQELLTNSRKTLKTLEVSFFHQCTESFKNLKGFFKALTNSGLDLNSFEMKCSSTIQSSNLLLDFLETQRSLEYLDVDGMSGTVFNERFEDIMAPFSKLKSLKLKFGEDNSKRYYRFMPWENIDEDFIVTEEEIQNVQFLKKPWSLLELKDLKLNYVGEEECQVPYNLLQRTSETLQKIEFSGNFMLYDSFFENISRNLGSLIELKVEDTCSDYSSNDIFWILKHLKKLKVLQFGFPKESELNPDLFVNNENLNLPVIEKVELRFNDSIDIDFATKLLQFMSNMSEFQFKYWNDYTTDFLVIVTRELSNLADLRIEEDTIEIEYSVLLKMQSNVREFNKKPNRFRIYYKEIDHWVEKAQKIAAENNEAECSMSKKLRLKPYFYSAL